MEFQLLTGYKSRYMRFVITTIFILFTRGYDIYSTYQYNPDLSLEANPLVSVLGFTWTPLLIVMGLLSVYAIYCYYKAVFHDYDLYPQKKDYSLSHFIGYLYLGEKQGWTSLLYKFPKDLKRFNHYMGHLLTKFLVFAGFVSTLMWLLLNYTDFYKEIHSANMIYSILILGSILISYLWFLKNYKEYQTLSSKTYE